MKFLKDNSYDIVKQLINQIGISIFAMIMYTAVSLIADIKLYLSIFAILFYAGLIFTAAKDMGAQDKLKVDSGKIDRNGFKGALIALFANVPNILLILLSILFMGIHLSSGAEWAYNVNLVVNLFLRLFSAMYIGVLTAIFPAEVADGIITLAGKEAYLYQSIGYLVCILIPIIASSVGYYLGLNNIGVSPKSKKH